jgi:class 3 adenylate cyclase
VDALDAEQVVLFGPMLDGVVACEYAAKHPERVSHLVLWNALDHLPPNSRPRNALLQVARDDWSAYTKAYMASLWGWERASEARQYARLLRESTDAETYLRHLDAVHGLDGRAVLGGIRAPTLVVLHPEQAARNQFALSGSRRLASAIPGAKLVHRAGLDYCPWLSEREAEESAALIEEFVEERGSDDVARPSAAAATSSDAAGDGGVRYMTTADGVHLAYVTAGSGPFVILPSNIYSISVTPGALTVPLLTLLADQRTLVRFDPRGMGLSDRAAMDFSLKTRVADVLAIAEAVGAKTFTLAAETYTAAVAITLAARHPDRVERLVLANPYASGERFYRETAFGQVAIATSGITKEQWEFITDMITARGAPAGIAPEMTAKRAGELRATWDPEGLLAFREATRGINITGELGKVTLPVLVILVGGDPAIQGLAREVAANLPDARLVESRTGSLASQAMQTGSMSREVQVQLARFLGVTVDEQGLSNAQEARAPAASVEHGMTAILFTDIADSTALTERLGDARFRDLSRALDAGLRAAIRECGGVTVEAKTLGDGVLATFGSAAQAIEGARRCLALSAASELGLHIGVHAGDVIREEGNVFGGAVNIAARICGLSEAGEILVSDVVRGMARSSAGVGFEDRGEREMKGVGEPVRVYAVVAG